MFLPKGSFVIQFSLPFRQTAATILCFCFIVTLSGETISNRGLALVALRPSINQPSPGLFVFRDFAPDTEAYEPAHSTD